MLLFGLPLLLAALGFLLHQRVDQFLVLLGLAGEVFREFAQSAIQARLAFLYCVLHHLQVLLQLVALFAPLGQRVDVPLQAGHVGIGILLEAGLQVVEAVLGVLQLACHFAVLVVERIPPFAVGLLFGLKLPLVAVELAFQVGDLPLGLFAVGGQLGFELPQGGIKLGQFTVDAGELGQRGLQRLQAHGLAHLVNPLAGLGTANASNRQLDAVLFENRRQHGLEGVHLALFGVHRRDQLFDMANAPLGIDQAELGGDLAQLQAIAAVAVELGKVVLDHRAELRGGPQLGRHRRAAAAQPAGPLGVVQRQRALLGLDQVVFRAVRRTDEAILHAAFLLAGQHRLAHVARFAAVFVYQVAVAMGQIERIEFHAGFRHHLVGQLAVKHRHQPLKRGFTRRVGAANIGVAIHTEFDHAVQVAVNHHDA